MPGVATRGSSVARNRGCGREEAVPNGPRRCQPCPSPPSPVFREQPTLPLQFPASKLRPAFKETSQFVSFPTRRLPVRNRLSESPTAGIKRI